MAYFGESTPEYISAAFQMLGDGGQNYNFAQVKSELVLVAPSEGVIIETLEFGGNSDPSQAGGTIEIGIYDITSGTNGATLEAAETLSLRSDNAGYVWHALTGLSIALAGSRTYALAIAKPTLNVFVTANADATTIFGESFAPATSSLPSTWETTNDSIRNIPLRAQYSLASSSSINSITTGGDPGLVVGQSFAITTTGLGDLAEVVARTTGGLNAITTAIDLDAPDGDGTAKLKFWVDGEHYPYIGTVSVEATDLTNNPTLNTTLSLPANHVDVVFEDPETTDNTYIGTKLAQAGHPLATGDRGYYINSNSLSISENGHVSCLSAMVFTLWIHKTNYIIEQYSVTVNDAGEVTDAKRVTNRKITTRAITTRLITERL